MKTTPEKIEVMQHYTNGGEVEVQVCGDAWIPIPNPEWNWIDADYRIKQPVDPYAELKAAAKDPTKQIRMKHSVDWDDAGRDWKWNFAPDDYEIREKPWKKKITMLAWFDGGRLLWQIDEMRPSIAWKRVPMQDKVIEVEV